MEHLIGKGTVRSMPFLRIAAVELEEHHVDLAAFGNQLCQSCLVRFPFDHTQTQYPSGFCLLAPSLPSVTPLLSLDVRLLSGLPGFDSWLSLKGWPDFGQEALQSTLNTTVPSESISLALMSWTAAGWLDWPEIQLMQKAIERWEYSLRLYEKLWTHVESLPNSRQLLLGENRICKS